MDYSARTYSDYERQQQSSRVPPYGGPDPGNPYSLDFSGDLYGLPSAFPGAKPQDMNGYAAQSSYGVDRRQSYSSDFHHDEYSNGMASNPMAFNSQPVSTYNDRLRYASDRYNQPSQPPQQQQQAAHADFANGASATAFRAEDSITQFDDITRFAPPQSTVDLPLPGPSGDSSMSRVPSASASGDLHSYL
ncbi:hypothetical protein DL96DRAFT_1625017, partial [Flagelloscypha sp. PMI_526]